MVGGGRPECGQVAESVSSARVQEKHFHTRLSYFPASLGRRAVLARGGVRRSISGDGAENCS